MKSYKFQQTATKGVKIQMAYSGCWMEVREVNGIKFAFVFFAQCSRFHNEIYALGPDLDCVFIATANGGGPVQALLWRLLVF